jgi:hypothetical protein
LDLAGRRTGVTQGSKTTVLTYNDANQWLTETNTAGTLAGLGMVRTFDTSMRLATVEGKNASGSLQGVLYGCDSAGRLSSVISNGYSATYSYVPNSLLVSGLAMTNGAGGGLATTKV